MYIILHHSNFIIRYLITSASFGNKCWKNWFPRASHERTFHFILYSFANIAVVLSKNLFNRSRKRLFESFWMPFFISWMALLRDDFNIGQFEVVPRRLWEKNHFNGINSLSNIHEEGDQEMSENKRQIRNSRFRSHVFTCKQQLTSGPLTPTIQP